MATVAEVLSAATDSVSLINGINTDGSRSSYASGCANQAEINVRVKQNVDHLSAILLYAPVDAEDDTPNVAGSAEDKSSYSAAVTRGNAYIAANS